MNQIYLLSLTSVKLETWLKNIMSLSNWTGVNEEEGDDGDTDGNLGRKLGLEITDLEY